MSKTNTIDDTTTVVANEAPATTEVTEATTTIENLTPYGAHNLVNAALKEAGLDKRIPPQMMYNYTTGRLNKGKAPAIKYSNESGVDVKDLTERWIPAYVASQVQKANPTAPATMPAESVEATKVE
jgi:hypothetical protein